MGSAEIFTVGHSNTDFAGLAKLLHQHGITAVADVRSQPYSRFLPHFSQRALKASLREAGIHYVFLGRELGARPDDPACYVNGKASYDRIAATPLFREGLERLRNGMHSARIALLCAEKDPLVCHRTILVCRHLRQPGLTIQHILADGSLVTQHELERRLLAEHGLQQLDLLQPRSLDEMIEEAYDRQGAAIAYTATTQGDDDHAERAS